MSNYRDYHDGHAISWAEKYKDPELKAWVLARREKEDEQTSAIEAAWREGAKV